MNTTGAEKRTIEDMIARVAKVVSPVFLVGGAVRDHLLGVTPKDFDFTTPLTSDEVEERVRAAGRRPFLTGKRFGTIAFKVEVDGEFEMVEITTFRTDGPGRKPTVVFEGVSVDDDLARRDLTIGAMVVDEGGVLHDPFGGKADLEAGIIRAVGKAERRYREDPLRILRVARFAAKLGFAIDGDTEKAAGKVASHLATISRERVRDEFDKLLVGVNPRAGLEFLARTRAMAFVLPEVAALIGFDQRSRFHDFDAFEHTVRVVENVEVHPGLRLAALLHDIGRPATKRDKGDRFTFVDHELVGAHLAGRIVDDFNVGKDRAFVIVALVARHLHDASPLKAADDAAKRESATA